LTDTCELYGNSSCDSPECPPGCEGTGYIALCPGPSAAFICAGGVVSDYTVCSDSRLKANVETLSGSLDLLLRLEPVEFDWKEITPQYDWFVEKGITHSIGFIAQQVKSVIPELVQLRDDSYYTIDYPRINALLVEGIKEQQVFIEEVEKDIIELEKYFNL
jgi:hypothetical protein